MAPRSCAFPLPLSPYSAVNASGFRFDKDNTLQDKKLDKMDLDDILNRAEDHETVTGGDGGASRDVQPKSPRVRGWSSEVLGDGDVVFGKVDRRVVRRIHFFGSADESGESWDTESGLLEERGVDLFKSGGVDSGDEVFHVLAVTPEFKFSEGRKGGTARQCNIYTPFVRVRRKKLESKGLQLGHPRQTNRELLR